MKTLLLVAHGSTSEPRALRSARAHAERIRGTDAFESVETAFLKGGPDVGDVLQANSGDEVVVVPLLTSEGYFAGTVVPREVTGAVPENSIVTYASPVGTSPLLSDVIRRRVRHAIGDRRDSVALALVGHGSERTPGSGAAVRAHADRLRTREEFESVRAFFTDEEPTVETLLERVDAEEIVAVPVFMAEGTHVREDIPRRLGVTNGGEEPSTVDGRTITYTDPVGTDPAIAWIALQSALEAVEGATFEGSSTEPYVWNASSAPWEKLKPTP